jgi:hypothetical protein
MLSASSRSGDGFHLLTNPQINWSPIRRVGVAPRSRTVLLQPSAESPDSRAVNPMIQEDGARVWLPGTRAGPGLAYSIREGVARARASPRPTRGRSESGRGANGRGVWSTTSHQGPPRGAPHRTRWGRMGPQRSPRPAGAGGSGVVRRGLGRAARAPGFS